ncbi:hypothetical protein W911_09830 [Hyphomicrobium nitrativorans NL23]|uniref:LTXXQ motif family protein n=1 Tax=Hyphomicrobium nitrativorans NL23 TaxID=1029756 RepID=V5SI40_9HYPH|nr:Spy/CpxP family protein refolding chaperone [Hyphomicrobium nitrativorans]AHB50167.1 hypothetical protein W911_09830 [Hyphomicrobium nitrativorans NL23]
MTGKKTFILAGIAAVAVGLTAASAIAHRGHHWNGHHKGHHAGHGGTIGFLDRSFANPGFSPFCRDSSAEFTDVMLVRLQHRLKITTDQQNAFDTFKTATHSAVEKLREGCPEGRKDRSKAEKAEKAGGDDKAEKTEATERKRPTPVDRLARRQIQLESSLEALKAYRPAAEAFYAVLTDDQKKTLTERRGKRHAHRGGKHGGKWEHRGPRHERGEHRGHHDRANDSDRDQAGETEREADTPNSDE